MRVLFLNPVPPEGKKVYTGFNHGIGSLSAVAKRAGHDTALLTFSTRRDSLLGQIADADPDCIALSSTSAQWPLAAWAASHLATSLPDVPIIAGGIHPTVATEETLSTPGIWAACRGEGEDSLLDMLSNLEFGQWTETPGFWTRPQIISGFGPTPISPADTSPCVVGEIVKNPPAALVDLSSLPHPDREIYPYQQILDRNRQNVGAEFIASRGCPHDCSYCVNHVLSDLTSGAWKKVRYRDPSDLVDEIASVISRYSGIRIVGFHDDVFALDKSWLASFAEKYRSRISLPFWCNQRVGAFTDDDVRLLKSAGCFRVHMGIETGDDSLRRNVLRRDVSSEAIEDAFALLRRHGLKTVAFNMLGIPFETEETLKATVNLNRRIRPDWIITSIFSPFPGTALADLAQSEGFLAHSLPESYYEPASALDQPSLSHDKLVYYYENFVNLATASG